MEPWDFALAEGAVVEELDTKARRQLMQRWRETFAVPVRERTGRWVYGGIEWHAFSWGFCQSRSGKRALADYFAEAIESLLVLPQDEGSPAFRCTTANHIDFTPCHEDVYIVPDSFDWTIAFTHEEGVGPFFSRPEWCDGLAVKSSRDDD